MAAALSPRVCAAAACSWSATCCCAPGSAPALQTRGGSQHRVTSVPVSPSPVSPVQCHSVPILTSYRQLVLPGRQVGQVRTRCPRVSAVQAAAFAVPEYITKYFYVYVNNIYFCLVFTTEPPALSPVPAPASPVACRSCPSLLPPAASAARSSSSSCGAESVTPPATCEVRSGPGVEQCWAANTLHSVTRVIGTWRHVAKR